MSAHENTEDEYDAFNFLLLDLSVGTVAFVPCTIRLTTIAHDGARFDNRLRGDVAVYVGLEFVV